jgi:hypothetical protein
MIRSDQVVNLSALFDFFYKNMINKLFDIFNKLFFYTN